MLIWRWRPDTRINLERWQSPVYCNSLENCRSARAREFESHPFRQIWCVDVMVAYWTVYPVAGVRFPYASPNYGELAEWSNAGIC